MIDYSKNLSLESIFHINDEGLVCLEEWRDIPNYEGIYQVSDLGRIKSLNYRRTNKENILKSRIEEKGYMRLGLFKNNKKKYLVHQLVAIAFLGHIPCITKLVVNHKNFIKTDNRKLNLEIITNRDNTNQFHLETTSKFIGVYWHKKSKKWMARIRIGKKHKYLGLHEKEENASKAYNDMLLEIYNT